MIIVADSLLNCLNLILFEQVLQNFHYKWILLYWILVFHSTVETVTFYPEGWYRLLFSHRRASWGPRQRWGWWWCTGRYSQRTRHWTRWPRWCWDSERRSPWWISPPPPSSSAGTSPGLSPSQPQDWAQRTALSLPWWGRISPGVRHIPVWHWNFTLLWQSVYLLPALLTLSYNTFSPTPPLPSPPSITLLASVTLSKTETTKNVVLQGKPNTKADICHQLKWFYRVSLTIISVYIALRLRFTNALQEISLSLSLSIYQIVLPVGKDAQGESRQKAQ